MYEQDTQTTPADLAARSQPGEQQRSPRAARRFVGTIHSPIVARAILGLALCLTGLAWWLSHGAVRQDAQNRFEFRAREIETAIAERMLGYENVLWGGVGLFDAIPGVTRDQFAEYVATLSLNERWPGIQGIGWSVPLEPDELASHQASIRAEGFADYSVQPQGSRDEYSAIVFLEPFDWRNQRAFGFDMWSNPERREAMSRARDTGRAATSSMITLVQETDEDVQRGFLTYVPVYEGGLAPTSVDERREALSGWVYAPFRMNDLMAGVLGSSTNSIDYQIFDGRSTDPSALLFDSSPAGTASEVASEVDSDLRQERTIIVQGQPWTIAFRAGEDFQLGSETAPTYIALAGLAIEILLFFVITALGTLNRRAEAIADERTVELRLTNDVLHQRSEELERQTAELRRSNDELREFAHVASHDLQEPLRSMAGYSSLVSSTYGDQLDEEGRRWLSYVNDGAQRLSGLIRDVLQFSTVDALNLSASKVDLNHTMQTVRCDLADRLAATSADVLVDDLPEIAGDPAQLRRLLSNLVCNAVTYHRPGVKPRVKILATQKGDMWRIHVRDNGIGIEPEFQERIFELFRRAAPKTPQPGTGLGLAICRKIVRAHGGDIGVISSPGNGTEFWFELPAFGPSEGATAPIGQESERTKRAANRDQGPSAKEYA